MVIIYNDTNGDRDNDHDKTNDNDRAKAALLKSFTFFSFKK